jgi:protein-L-isoaspartate(D-aspartate) O-methyltransferase
MTEALGIKPGQNILEVGTGSGYQAAVLAELTDKVYTVEIRKTLAKRAAETVKRLGYTSIHVKHGDGYFGWEENAPYDAIIITCAANHIPSPLLKQLKVGGKLIIPLGSTSYNQTLAIITKKETAGEVTYLTDVAFVPMTGEAENRKSE